jgi:hypothetical protein
MDAAPATLKTKTVLILLLFSFRGAAARDPVRRSGLPNRRRKTEFKDFHASAAIPMIKKVLLTGAALLTAVTFARAKLG